MRYLLVLQPTDLNGKGSSRMPLGLPYINGAMRAKGFDVEAVNLQYVDGAPMEVLKDTIREKRIDAVMCGGITIEYPLIKAVFDAAREANPAIITIGGGGGFSSEPILFSEMTGVDYAVIGEGEITDCELAYALDHGLDTDDIKGLVIKKEDGYIFTGERGQIKDLDTIAFPSYEGLDLDKYLDEQTVDGWYHTFAAFTDDPRIMPILMSRSCPFMCTFCYHPIGRGYRTRSMDSFFEELDGYIRKYRINAIALVDECFSINPERVEEFCRRIKPYHLFWSCQMRVETYSEELIKMMVDSGCVSACFGLENMSQTILDDMNKKATVGQMEKALEVAYRCGGGVVSNILFGAEAETPETIRETMTFVNANPRYTINDFVMIGAYPGSGYYEHAVRRGIIQDKRKFIESGCPTINLTSLTEKKFRALEKYSYLKRQEIYNKGEVVSVERQEKGYDAVLKCAHCGYENHYKGISEKTYEQGVCRAMECRKCHNYSDYLFDGSKVREKWHMAEWIYDCLVGNENDCLKRWVLQNGIKTAAVYGMRFAGMLMDELASLGVDVKYGIDRNYEAYQGGGVNVYGLEEDYEKVDAIVVVSEHYEEIIRDMKERTDIRLFSLEEIAT